MGKDLNKTSAKIAAVMNSVSSSYEITGLGILVSTGQISFLNSLL